MMKNRFFIIAYFFIFSSFSAIAETVYDGVYSEFSANGEALIAIGADKAYTGSDGTAYSGFSGQGVTVAVIDSGAMTQHPDLGNQLSNRQEAEFNIFAGEHGTHVSGIIAAEKNDSGMHGVAYNSDLLVFSTALGDGCESSDGCMEPTTAWETLLDSKYDDVKIINNSWGVVEDIDDGLLASFRQLTESMAAKDKLIVAAAGNDMELNPSVFPAGIGQSGDTVKNNIISVVAYDASKNPSDRDFIESFSNLAGYAKEWTLAAPGDINSTILYDQADPSAPQFGLQSGTSVAAPVVSGAAALVQEAFPYLGGKQIADVLFSTAKKKDDLELSPFMIQHDDESGKTRVLFFTDNKQGITFEAAQQAAAALGYECGESISCHEVTFEDVFGQGLLDVGAAVKGIKYFDASRLTSADYDMGKNQFFYSVDTSGFNSVWSNNIGQVQSTQDQYATANIGLKKKGDGTLTLAGANTFLGSSIVEGGELKLTGSMPGDVSVSSGTFSMSDNAAMNGDVSVSSGTFSMSGNAEMNGDVSVSSGTFSMSDNAETNGKITTNPTGVFQINAGTFADLENKGKVLAVKGSSAGNIINNGTFSVAGVSGEEWGNFVSTGSFTNKNNFKFEEKGLFSGVLNNDGAISVVGNSKIQGELNNGSSGSMVVNAGAEITADGPINNDGILSGFGKITGSVVNNASGSVAASLNISDLSSSGNIILTSSADGSGTATMTVERLEITGGTLTIASDNINYENGQTYTLIKFDTLAAFENFQPQAKLSDFIVATPHVNGDRIDVTIDYVRMTENAVTESFLPEEKIVVGIMDKLYLDDDNKDFKRYFYRSAEELKKDINAIRSKVKPIQKEHLPLAGTMSSQVSTHLFKMNMNRDAATFHRQYTPMQQYRGRYYNGGSGGRYYRGRSGGNAPKTGSKIWGQILGGRVVEDADSLDKKEITTRTVGGMIGYDHEISSQTLVGVTAGYASGRLTQDMDEINVKDYRAGIYTGSRFGKLTFNTMLLGGFQQYKGERYSEIAGLETLNRSEFNGYSADLDLNLGYDFMRLPYRDYSFYLRSYLAANVNYISQDSYEEKGESSVLLGVDSMNNTSVSVQPGITIGYTFSQAVITADFSYQRILSGDSVQSSAYFLADAAKTPFDSLSTETDKDYFNAGIGLKTDITRNTRLNLWAGMRKSDNTEAINFAASLSYAF